MIIIPRRFLVSRIVKHKIWADSDIQAIQKATFMPQNAIESGDISYEVEEIKEGWLKRMFRKNRDKK